MSSDTQTVVPTPATPAPPATTQASLAARLGTEAFGTFGLVLAIVGVALYGSYSNAGIVLPVALAGGLVVVALVAGLGHVSGGHFNPAVTFGVTVAGRARWADLVPYWLAQIVGGVLAAGALFVLIPENFAKFSSKTTHEFFAGTANGFGTHSPLYAYFQSAAASNSTTLADYETHFGATLHGPSMLQAILIEAIVTALFVGVVIAVTDKRTNTVLAPIAIGLALFVAISVSAPMTNGSVNPARSTASAVFAANSIGDIFTGHGIAGQLWVFWVGPLLGALIAGLFYLAFAAARPVPAADNPFAAGLDGAEVVVVEEIVVTEVDAVVVEEDAPAAAADAAPAADEAAAPVADDAGIVLDKSEPVADVAEDDAADATSAEDTDTDDKPDTAR